MSSSGFRLAKWERWLAVSTLLLLAGARFVWPDLPIDGTLVGLLGLAFVLARWDIESLEFLGVKARTRVEEFERITSGLRSLEPPSPVETPDSPPAVTDQPAPTGSSLPNWYTRASKAATDLDVPSEPVARILWSAEQIRIELILLLGNTGNLDDRSTPWHAFRPRALASQLAEAGLLPPEIGEAIQPFMETRNRVAHGHRVPDELLDAADSTGLSLVTTLRSIPREWIRVVKPDIAIYADRSRTHRHSVGVMLVQLDDAGRVRHRGVYPGPGYYPTGAFVTWEWNKGEASRQEGWYEDPDSGKSVLAWSQSLFFAGRPYPDEWGLMHRFPRPDAGLPSAGPDALDP